MKKNKLFHLILWMISAVSISCTPASRDPIRLGITPFPGYTFFYLAKAKGYLDEPGRPIQLIHFASLADSRKAFERKQLDVMAGTCIELLNIRAMTPLEAQAIFVIDISKGADVLLAQNSIATLRDLNGKKVAFESQTIDTMMVYHALRSAGMSFRDILPSPMSQLEMVQAFNEQTIDAAEVYPPAANRILDSGKAHALFDSSKAPLTVIDILIAENSLLKQNPELRAALMRAFVKAYEFSKKHPNEAKHIISEIMQIPDQDYDHLYDGLEFPSLDQQPELLRRGGAVEKNLLLSSQVFKEEGLLPALSESIVWTAPFEEKEEMRQGAENR